MAEYIERVPFEALIEHLNKKEPCKRCYHRAACDAWVRNATTQYDDYSYYVENCPYYKPTTDVVEVVRCKDCIHYEANGFVYEEGCGRCDHPRQQWEVECYDQWVETRPNDFCSYGERRETDDKG